ncbi:carboxylesterase/lipase family protein [Agarivorans sp. QJM3NY_25]|uniref:carboxylesterase/lipase family protein n=1 Tax=Agarivorans sp. QJM3NY_25 TaxID=3421430 RepID=UPI003D7DACA3
MKLCARKIIHLCAALLIAILMAGCNDDHSQTFPYQGVALQETQYGFVEGFESQENNTIGWLGLPYAQPPIAELRWKAPQSPEAWHGTLQAKAFKDGSIQGDNSENATGSEDSLYLNIWRPNTADKDLPVLLFVHGGGNRSGSPKEFIGDKLAEATNSIVISIDYRLGAIGWFRHPALKSGDLASDSGNFGLLDIIQSLKWVNQNISSFGGDPGNVTLAGQSAGARDTLALMISPLASGLFHKILALSGGMTTSETSAGDAIAQQAVIQLVINNGEADNQADAMIWIAQHEDFAAYLRAQEADKFLALYGPAPIKMAPFPHLFKDGYVLPAEGFEVLKTGHYNKVPVMLGSAQQEFAIFALTDPEFAPLLRGSQDPDLLDSYGTAMHYGSNIYAAFNVENVADQLVGNPDQPPVFGYRFAWGTRSGVVKSPADTLGLSATHGADMDFITGQWSSGMNQWFNGAFYFDENQPGRDALSAAMMAYIGNFLHTDSPNGEDLTEWQAYSVQHQIMRLDADLGTSIIAMSDAVYDKNQVDAEMQTDLASDEYHYYIDKIISGRFFWDLWME